MLVFLQSKADQTKVLFIGGLPSDATEGDIVQLGLPFGRMTAMILNKKKNQVCNLLTILSCILAMITQFLPWQKYYGNRLGKMQRAQTRKRC